MEFEGGPIPPMFCAGVRKPGVCSSYSPSNLGTVQVIQFKSLAGGHSSKDFWSVRVLAPLPSITAATDSLWRSPVGNNFGDRELARA